MPATYPELINASLYPGFILNVQAIMAGNGDVRYVFGVDVNVAAVPASLRAYKSTDRGDTWVEVDAAGAPSVYNINAARKFSCSQPVRSIPRMTFSYPDAAAFQLTLIEFDGVTDTWGVPVGGGPVLQQSIGWNPDYGSRTSMLGVRAADGSSWVLYQGPVENVAGVDYDRCYLVKYDAGWGAPVANVFGAAGVAADYTPLAVINGSGGRLHVFCYRRVRGPVDPFHLLHFTIDSGDVVQVTQTVANNITPFLEQVVGKPSLGVDNLTLGVVYGVVSTSGALNELFPTVATAQSADVPVWAYTTVTTDESIAAAATVSGMCLVPGFPYWTVFWADNNWVGVYRSDFDGTNWSTPVLAYTNVAGGVTTNLDAVRIGPSTIALLAQSDDVAPAFTWGPVYYWEFNLPPPTVDTLVPVGCYLPVNNNARVGPYVNGTDLYVVGFGIWNADDLGWANGQIGLISIHKSVDNGVTWAAQDIANHRESDNTADAYPVVQESSVTDPRSFAAVQSGTQLYVFYIKEDGTWRVSQFSMVADAWVGESVSAGAVNLMTAAGGVPKQTPLGRMAISINATGIWVATGDQNAFLNPAGDDQTRISYNRLVGGIGGVWDGWATVPGQSRDYADYRPMDLASDTLGRVHMIYDGVDADPLFISPEPFMGHYLLSDSVGVPAALIQDIVGVTLSPASGSGYEYQILNGMDIGSRAIVNPGSDGNDYVLFTAREGLQLVPNDTRIYYALSADAPVWAFQTLGNLDPVTFHTLVQDTASVFVYYKNPGTDRCVYRQFDPASLLIGPATVVPSITQQYIQPDNITAVVGADSRLGGLPGWWRMHGARTGSHSLVFGYSSPAYIMAGAYAVVGGIAPPPPPVPGGGMGGGGGGGPLGGFGGGVPGPGGFMAPGIIGLLPKGTHYVPTLNRFDKMLRKMCECYSQLDWVSMQCPWLGLWDGASMPNNAVEYLERGVVVTPAPGEVLVVDTFVPLGYESMLYGVLLHYTGTGFVEGSGDIVWRVRIGNRWLTGYGNTLFSRGVPDQPFHLADHVAVRSGARMQVWVNVPNLSGAIQVGLSNIVCALQGWHYPA